MQIRDRWTFVKNTEKKSHAMHTLQNKEIKSNMIKISGPKTIN